MTTATAPETPDPVAASEPWDRRPDETIKAFRAFVAFRDAGPDRSVPATYRQVTGRLSAKQAGGGWNVWASKHEWHERAAAWDAFMDRERRAAMAREAARQGELWERRRQEAAEACWGLSERLIARATEMLARPLDDSRWTLATAATMAKTASELQATALVGGMAASDDNFDPTSASPEELRAYLAKMGVKPPGS
jgi:hypothetical protein